MKVRKRLLFALGFGFLGMAWFIHDALSIPATTRLIETKWETNGCRMPVEVISPAAQGGDAFAIVLHGLGANRRIMKKLGMSLAWSDLRVFLVDLPGHGDNTDSFSVERAEACTAALLESLAAAKEIVPERTVLIGHSFGGALAIRLADRFPTAATVALSPAPMVEVEGMPAEFLMQKPPQRIPSNLLLVLGQLDIPQITTATKQLVEMAGGERFAKEDFDERRAVRLYTSPRATHTSLLVHRDVWAATDAWWRRAIPMYLEARSFVGHALSGAAALGFVGLMLIFAGLVRWLAALLDTQSAAEVPAQLTVRTISAWLAGGVAAVVLMSFLRKPLAPEFLYSNNYLAFVLVLAGVAVVVSRATSLKWQAAPRGMALAATMGLFVVLAFAWWLAKDTTDLLLNGARWGRLVWLTAMLSFFGLAEEIILGSPPQTWRRKLGRHAISLLLRLALWMCIAVGAFTLGSGQALILVMFLYMAVFSVFTRLGADSIWRHTGSMPAAALFNAMLTAWFLAAVFPLV